MRAYHFLRDDMTAGSGNEPAWAVGETRTIEGELELCKRGYHSSPSWFDALQYAPGAMACIVEVSEPAKKRGDKQVSKTRTLIDCRDATRVLHLFAIESAERALRAAQVKDEACWNALKVKRDWLDGKATNEELDAVWAASWDVAWDVAWDAAWGACRADERDWQRMRFNEMVEQLFEEGA